MDAKQRAAEADQILSNPVFKEAMAGIRKAITNSIYQTDWRDVESLQHYKRLMDCADMFENRLRMYLQDGLIEADKLKRKKTIKERVLG